MKAKAKNLVAIFAAALALLMSVVLFAACGDGNSGSDPVGTYKFSSMTMGEETYKVGDEIPGLGQKFDENYLTIELKEDNTFTMSVMGIPGGEEGTWELDGKTLTLTAGESPMECTLSGGTITMEDDSGATIKLKK